MRGETCENEEWNTVQYSLCFWNAQNIVQGKQSIPLLTLSWRKTFLAPGVKSTPVGFCGTKLILNTICVDKSTTHLCISMTKHTNWEGEYSIGPWKWAELSRTAYLNTTHHNIAIMQLQFKCLHATSTYLKTTFIVTLFVQGRVQVIRKVFIGEVEE